MKCMQLTPASSRRRSRRPLSSAPGVKKGALQARMGARRAGNSFTTCARWNTWIRAWWTSRGSGAGNVPRSSAQVRWAHPPHAHPLPCTHIASEVGTSLHAPCRTEDGESPYASMVHRALAADTPLRHELGLEHCASDEASSPQNPSFWGTCDGCERDNLRVRGDYPGWANLSLCLQCWRERRNTSGRSV